MTVIDCCEKGHPYTPENTRVVKSGARQCRLCDKYRAQIAREKKRGDKVKFARPQKERCFRDHEMSGDNLYFYTDANEKQQRRCRACDRFRDEERRNRAETVQPTKSHCENGHPMSGDNLSFRSNGFAVCLACQRDATTRHKEEHYEEVMEAKNRNRRAATERTNEQLKALIVEAYDTETDDDELIRRLREVLS